ncbi:MAG TPA: choice-of-anchor D domain-containing protein [Candidatus Acidoferrales bacterium]|nr:choice-of-anchor D domain-containing protein [Candidatus Acidoferrales bacterium]
MVRKVYLSAISLCAVALLLSGQRPPRATARRLAAGGPQGQLRDTTLEQRVRAAMRAAPLQFEENVGQADARAKFLARGDNFALALTPQEADLSIHTTHGHEKQPQQLEPMAVGWADAMAASALVRVEFAGGNPEARLTGVGAQSGTINYLRGNDPKRWERKVPHFARVRYQGVYPGVDAVFYGDRRQMEFDFEVAPGTDPSAIRLRVDGAASVELTEDGGLEARTPAGVVSLREPKLFQEREGGKQEIAGRYIWRDGGEIGFEVSGYDRSQALVIDPQASVHGPEQLRTSAKQQGRGPRGKNGSPPPDTPPPTGSSVALSTLLGGTYDDSIQAIAIGATSGHVYVAGWTNSYDFPLTGGQFQDFFAGSTYNGSCFVPQFPCGDAFVAELDVSTLTAPVLVNTTYLGGQGDEAAWGIALDANDNVFVVGETDSGDFPTEGNIGAYQPQAPIGGCSSDGTLRACHHVFLTELNPGLSFPIYSTYLAGTDDDEGYAVAVNATGQAFITGVAGANFPQQCACSTQSYAGGGDIFVAEFDTTAPGMGTNGLVYSVTLGGDGTDAGLSIAVDGSNNAFAGGVTYSTITSNPLTATSLALQEFTVDTQNCGPGFFFACGDGFVAVFDSTGAGQYFTFLGGSFADQVNAIAVDSFDNVFVTGQTLSFDFQPVTQFGGSRFQSNYNCCGYDAFVVNFQAVPDSSPFYSTYLGGGGDDIGLGIAIDASGDAFVSGSTTSNPDNVFLPVNALKSQPSSDGGGPTSFVSVLDVFGQTLLFSTYYGGPQDYYGNVPTDYGNAIALDAQGRVYLAGRTTSYANTSNTSSPFNGGAGLCLINQIPGAHPDSFFSDNNGFLVIINPADSAAGCFSPSLTSPQPLVFTFASALQGMPSPTTNSLTIFDQGSMPLTETVSFSGTNGGDFTATATTPGCTLDPMTMMVTIGAGGGSCELDVAFTPSTASAESATLVLTDNGNCPANSPCQVSLQGQGLPPAAPLSIVPFTSASFPNTATGTTSPAQIFNFTNNSTTSYTDVSAVSFNPATSDFQIVLDLCTGTQVQANGGTCSIYVTFTPQATGMRSATLQVTDDGATNPTLTLTGMGTTPTGNAPTAGITTLNLSFAPQGQGTTSATQILTVTNTGATGSNSLTLQPLSFTGTNAADFTIVGASTTCSPSVPLAVGASCSIGVAFAPMAPDTGALSAMLAIASNATNSPLSVNVSGTSLGPPVAMVSGTVNFPPQVMSTTSAPMNVTLTNTGGSPMTISGVAFMTPNTGDFGIFVNTCGSSLAAGANCVVAVTFTPTATGPRTAQLQFTDNAAGSPQSVTLNGTGAAGPAAALTPGTLTFAAAQQLNTTSAPMAATLTNSGGAALSITSIGASGDFAVLSSSCGTSLAANSNCQINVTFTPTAAGTRNGMLTVMDAVGTQMINLTGTGVTPPTATLSSNTVTFGTQAVGVTSTAMQVMLTNSGGSQLNVSAIAPTGDFAESDNCQPAVQAGTMCTINITFTPSGVGQRNGSLLIVDNAAGSPQTIMLSGTGSSNVPGFNLAAPLFFGAVLVGTTSAAQTVTITNAGGAPLTISGVMASAQFGVASNNCTTVNIGLSCMISVTFTPTGVGTQTGTLTIMDNAPGSPHTVSLSGVGAMITMSPSPGASSTLTVTPGDTAQYNLSVTGTQGLVVTLNLSCVSAAPYTKCSVSPSSVTLGGPAPPTVVVTVQTNCNPALVGPARRWPPPILPAPFVALWMGTLVLFVLLRKLAPNSRLTHAAPVLVLLLLVITWAGCVSNPPPAIPGAPTTPAGTYMVTVTANGMNVNQSLQLTIRVI